MYSWNDGVLIELSRIEIQKYNSFVEELQVLIELSRIEIRVRGHRGDSQDRY